MRSILRRAASLLVLSFATTLHAADAPRDPIEGRWLGTIGTPRERVPAGLEFVRDAVSGELTLKLTLPSINAYGNDAGAPVVRRGDRVEVAPLHLALALKDGRLEGHYPGPNSPATFERARTLPRQPDPPKVPEGHAPRWQARLGGQVYASPVVHDGIAYVGSTGGVFNAVDTRDGAFVWTYAAGRPILGAAAVTDDAVYFACDDGALHKLARADGKLAWRHALGDAASARVLPHPAVFDWAWHAPEPLVDGDLVVVGDGDGTVHAIDAASGARRWRYATRGAVRGGAALAGTRVVVGSADGTLYALERDTGREAWRFDTGAPIETRPLVHDGRVLVGNRGYGLYAIDAATGKEAWKTYFWGSWVESTPVVFDGTLYIGASDSRRVSAIDPADGRVLWRTDVFGWTFGTPLVDGDVIHVGAAGGTPYFIRHLASYATLDRSTGRILTRRAIPDPGGHQWGIVGSLALSGDTVVYATLSGSLYGVPRR